MILNQRAEERLRLIQRRYLSDVVAISKDYTVGTDSPDFIKMREAMMTKRKYDREFLVIGILQRGE